MSSFTDHYANLGITREPGVTTQADIRQAYIKIIRASHPDKSNSPDATQRAAMIIRSWEVLKDPATRADYDQQWHAARLARAQAKADQTKAFEKTRTTQKNTDPQQASTLACQLDLALRRGAEVKHDLTTFWGRCDVHEDVLESVYVKDKSFNLNESFANATSSLDACIHRIAEMLGTHPIPKGGAAEPCELVNRCKRAIFRLLSVRESFLSDRPDANAVIYVRNVLRSWPTLPVSTPA